MKANFWAKVLKEKDLESPGREEAVKATLEAIAEKERIVEEQRNSKYKGKGK